MMRESEFSHCAADESLPLRDAFAVLFFVSVGMLFDPQVLIEHPVKPLLVIAIVMIGKTLAPVALVRGSISCCAPIVRKKRGSFGAKMPAPFSWVSTNSRAA
jgi:predicted Kef-type K+ transport protein